MAVNRKTLPDFHENSLSYHMLPDQRFTFHTFSAHCRSVEAGWAYPSHDHPLFELNMVIKGNQTMVLEGRRYEMSPGDLLWIKPGEIHESLQAGEEGLTYACIHFEVDEPYLKQGLVRLRHSLHHPGSPLWEAVHSIIESIGAASAGTGTAGDEGSLRLKSLALSLELLSALSRLMADPPAGLLGDPRGYAPLAVLIAEKMEKLVGEHSGLDDEAFIKQGITRISKELGYTPAYCTRMFKSVYGSSPRQYLSAMKLREAKLLLMERELSVEQVAERLGYKDASHFSKQFKRWTHLSPSEYRQTL